jgi:hypothetical protein
VRDRQAALHLRDVAADLEEAQGDGLGRVEGGFGTPPGLRVGAPSALIEIRSFAKAIVEGGTVAAAVWTGRRFVSVCGSQRRSTRASRSRKASARPAPRRAAGLDEGEHLPDVARGTLAA